MSEAKEVEISAELTPNPNTLKFVISRPLLEKGSVNFTEKADPGESPLAAELFEEADVKGVLIGSDFVTVTKSDSAQWPGLATSVVDKLRAFLNSDKEVITAQAKVQAESAGEGNEVEARIKKILDEEIRPAVARDGGDIVFQGFEEGVVKLHLQGACSSCPSSVMTLKMGIENRLKALVPEVKEVVQSQ